MNENKMNSADVPQKFTEWLLLMGCSPDKIPSTDKMTQMCRGQYYMVWRSMMEHVQPKDVIREKRMQVFCDDVNRYHKAHTHSSTGLMPAELLTWKRNNEVKTEVSKAETRVLEYQSSLKQAMDKVSIRLSQRNINRAEVKDSQRRAWLLRTAAEELKCRKESLIQTKAIGETLIRAGDDTDVQNKLDKCLALFTTSPKKAAGLSMSCANPVASSSVMSITSENEHTNPSEDQPTIPPRLWNQLSVLTECSPESLWTQFNGRLSTLVQSLSMDNSQVTSAKDGSKGLTPQSIVTHTAFLIYSLTQDKFMYRMQSKQVQKEIASVIANLNLTAEGCELLVLRCEVVKAEAKLGSLRAMLKTLRAGAEPFCGGHDGRAYGRCERSVLQIDREIEALKENIKKLIVAKMKTTRKIQKVKEKIDAVLMGFQVHSDGSDKYLDMELDLPEDSIAYICKFYKEYQEKKVSTDLSLNLDVSEDSFSDAIDNSTEPNFVDELKLYLNKFKLEDNRKLVLENGEKIWFFESLKSAVSRLRKKCLSENVSCDLMCPSLCLTSSFDRLVDSINEKSALNAFVQILEDSGKSYNIDVNIDQYKADEEERVDKIKKQLNNNILSLQKTNKILAIGQDNLKLWADNTIRNYISPKRTVDSKNYKEYEAMYLEYLNPTV